MEYTEFQHFTHVVGSTVLLVLYAFRIRTLIGRRVAADRSPDPKGDMRRGVREAFFTIFMPWRMDSTRRHWLRYTEFVAFHIGVFTTIGLSFAFTYAAGWLDGAVRTTLLVLIGAGLLSGAVRLARRAARPEMRIISSFDDYASMLLVLAFEVTGILTLLDYEWATLSYFVAAFLILLYEPFSKLRHYIYFPFARAYHGRAFARRGVMGRGVGHV